MRLAVFSDVHGNLPALEKMLDSAGLVDGYICLGDTVNYGPWGDECIDVVTSLPNVVFLRGNHEEYFVRGRYDGRNPVVQTFFDICYRGFHKFREISRLEVTHVLNRYLFTHTIGRRYIFADTPIELDGNYVIGHSHRQFRISQPPFELCNPGSVGQNRENIDVAQYMTLEVDAMKFEGHSVAYDAQVVIREMQKQGYPEICVRYYRNKLRQ